MTARRQWPWFVWVACGLLLEAVALAGGRIDPLTRVVRRVRSSEIGRFLYDVGDWHIRREP